MTDLPGPVTEAGLYLAAIHDELRTIRQHLDGTSPSSSAADGEGEDADPVSGLPVHVGGPWFRLPNGERVKGKAEAHRRAANLRG